MKKTRKRLPPPPLVYLEDVPNRRFPKPSGLRPGELGTQIDRHVREGDLALKRAERHFMNAGAMLREAHKKIKLTTSLKWEVWLKHHVKISRAKGRELIDMAKGKLVLFPYEAEEAREIQERRGLRETELTGWVEGATLTQQPFTRAEKIAFAAEMWAIKEGAVNLDELNRGSGAGRPSEPPSTGPGSDEWTAEELAKKRWCPPAGYEETTPDHDWLFLQIGVEPNEDERRRHDATMRSIAEQVEQIKRRRDSEGLPTSAFDSAPAGERIPDDEAPSGRDDDAPAYGALEDDDEE